MKQLTKEQHEAICEWLTKNVGCTTTKAFEKDFEPACCDSCADGEECESDKSIPDQSSEFDDNLAIEKKYYEEHPERKPLVAHGVSGLVEISIDRKPEESASEYMDRVAEINGRKHGGIYDHEIILSK